MEKRIMILAAVLIAGLFALISCGTQAGSLEVRPGHKDTMKHPEMEGKSVEEVITQTKCPVMGGAIDKKSFVEHDGRKVYFCCAGCSEPFKKNPGKYLNKHKMHGESKKMNEGQSGHLDGAMNKDMKKMKVKTEVVQDKCPIMGGAINKNLFVEYEGRKIYFCCAGCPDTFKKDPAKYMKKHR